LTIARLLSQRLQDWRLAIARLLCRTYCNLLRPELSKLLEQKLETGQSFFTLFRAVHHLEQITLRWAPSTLGTPPPPPPPRPPVKVKRHVNRSPNHALFIQQHLNNFPSQKESCQPEWFACP
jgi:hypothetical protein